MSLVYHYCNVDAFVNIISNCILWLSDIKRSNDPREGGLLIGDIFDYWNSHDGWDMYPSWIMDLIQEYDCEMRLYNNFFVYALCFSQKGDLLSQWRGYTQDAAGVSIGMDEAFLKKWSYSFENRIIAEYCKVKYGGDEEATKQMFDKLYSLAKDVDFNFNPEDRERLSIPFYQCLEKLSIQAFAMKEKGYSEEKEKRILYREYYHYDDKEGYQFMDYSSVKNLNNHIPDWEIKGPKYNIWKSGYKKYYELGFSRIRDRFIREIILGPQCELSVEDVRELLAREGYPIVGNNKVEIRRSSIAYSAR